MNSNAIEKIAVSHLNLAIAQCEFLRAEISDNDKTPSFDGYIELYSKAGNKKSDWIGRCDVQVKGKTVKNKKFKGNITYPAEVDDLKNYFKNGGVVYFVVSINKKNTTQHQIYYCSLLPFDLKQIITQLKPNQETKSIKLEKFPTNSDQIKQIFMDFLFHKRQQFNSTNITDYKSSNTSGAVATYKIWTNSISAM